ncbi:MAG: hypothetical protein DMG70_24610 [Acidobacteria bacterium]|nr:MAG: hypothetical protein DMG70_24610 [Acidobacteriota bacterium]PYY09742.1 MAG: hypothetical protein DMG69_09610 [Acidobacteriota bacterium]
MINQPFVPIRMLLARFLAGSIVFLSALAVRAVEPPGQVDHTVSSPMASAKLVSARPPSVTQTVSSERAAMVYSRIWGVDDLRLRETASGSMIRFSYRVVDATKAKVLNNKKFSPTLTDQTSGARLEVPVMEKVGQLRQTATPENGREYWMVFSNRSHIVKPGNRVTVVIGTFRAQGLVVEASTLSHTR